ncbi:unnamed protein product [Urochloa humidicola]
MANFAVDPYPFVPKGFTLIPQEVQRGPARMRSFLAFSLDKVNEDLAIAVTHPPVAKEDFKPFARQLHRYLLDHQVCHPEIQMCPMGEAYVRFDSPMQRESFIMSDPREFVGYQLHFIRHDEGPNFKDLDIDCVAWLMLLCFPPDAKNLISLVDKSIAGFGQLLHVHNSSSLCRLIVKVLVNKDSDVPESITLAAGSEPRIRTWTVPVYLLKVSDVVLGGNEQPLPEDGPIHPMPNRAPRWMGPHGPGVGFVDDNVEAEHEAGNMGAGSNNVGDAGDMGEGNNNNEDADAERQLEQGLPGKVGQQQSLPGGVPKVSKQTSFSGASADFAASGGMKRDLPPLGPSTLANQVSSHILSAPLSCQPPLCPFWTISIFVINLSAQVPSYISDDNVLWFLAKVVVDPMEMGEVGCKRKLFLAEDEAEEATEDEVRIIPKEEAVIKPNRKRRAKKMRTPLSKKFVRRSSRINKDLDGFRDKESKDAYAEEKEENVEAILEVQPLAMVPADDIDPSSSRSVGKSAAHASPAPFFSVDNVKAMATGFLKMQPGVVSEAALLASSDDE